MSHGELKRTELSVRQERAILVGVIVPSSNVDGRDPLDELASLAGTAGARVVAQVIQRRHKPDAGTYIGRGKAVEIAQLAMQHEADVVIFDNDLSPAQIGALEQILNEAMGSKRGQAGIKILDRSELILDIFATRARTHEAKLQVELAQMEYTYPRLARMWGHLERIAGSGAGIGIGTRGPGETQLETDRRIVRRRIADLRGQIEQVQARKRRQVAHRARAGHYTVCIVGYTNAGKSTLFNTLTAAGTYADDKLFATLDTKTRSWQIDRATDVMLSDTVGFVRDLPHNLVASFKATLEEAVHADLLLHVLDVSHRQAQLQYQTVQRVLDEIGARGDDDRSSSRLLLLNKTDTERGAAAADVWRTLYPDAVAISARTGTGLDRLASAVVQRVRGAEVDVTLEADLTDGRLLAFIESHSRVHDRQFLDGRVQIRASMARQTLGDLSRTGRVAVQRVAEPA